MRGGLAAARGRRIALLIESDGPGGAEQVVAHLAEGAAARGYEITLFVPRGGEGWLHRRLAATAVELVPVVLEGPLSLRSAVDLARALRARQCELLHTHEFGEALTGACAARWVGIPHLITMHGGVYFAERARRRAVLRAAIALSAGVTAVATPVAAAIGGRLRLPPERIRIIANGAYAAPAEGPSLPRPAGLPVGRPLLLAVGNLYPVKGHRYLVSALARLLPKYPGIELAIAGRGDEESALRAQARAEGVADRVHLLGLRDDVGALLAAADLFVHPSLAEGLPLAVLEAMFAGRPVVASAVGDLPTVLARGSAGRLVPAGDPVALALGIDDLLKDPGYARSLADRARARAGAEYTIARMVDRYEALYLRVLGDARAA